MYIHHIGSPSVPHQKPIGSAQKPLSSTPKTPQFNTKNSSLQHQKPLSSTLSFLVWNWGRWIWGVCGVELRAVWNWGVFEAEKEWPFYVKMMCWTEWVWNWGGPERTVLIEIQIFGLIILAKRCVFSISFVNFDKLVIEHVNSFR